MIIRKYHVYLMLNVNLSSFLANSCKEVAYCYHSVNVITLSLSQRDFIKRLPLYYSKNCSCMPSSGFNLKLKLSLFRLQLQELLNVITLNLAISDHKMITLTKSERSDDNIIQLIKLSVITVSCTHCN
jgi:hypothetical protein